MTSSKLTPLAAAFMLVLGACGSTTAEATREPDSSAATDQPVTTAQVTTALPTSTAAPTTTEAPRPPTVDELLATDGVLNIPHAGGDQDAPHSTMFAFTSAVEAGADVLEMDVRLTADGVLVVHHDADTAKTTPEGLVVAETDLATLQALDKAYWFTPDCWPCQDRPAEESIYRGMRTGEVTPPAGFTADDFRLVTLEEVSTRFPTLPFDIEIKGEGAEGLAVGSALADELVRLDRADSTVVVSFDSEVITAFHDAAPDVATSPGVAELTAWLLEGVPLAAYHRVLQVPPVFGGVEVLNAESVARAHSEGFAIWVWMDSPETQENEVFYRSLVDLGIDGIIAGRPAQAETATAG